MKVYTSTNKRTVNLMYGKHLYICKLKLLKVQSENMFLILKARNIAHKLHTTSTQAVRSTARLGFSSVTGLCDYYLFCIIGLRLSTSLSASLEFPVYNLDLCSLDFHVLIQYQIVYFKSLTSNFSLPKYLKMQWISLNFVTFLLETCMFHKGSHNFHGLGIQNATTISILR